ncbi:MAG: BTAD domain-containing putative transcriptional regulator, partial [Longimicrobiales bacterium]
RRLMEMLDRNGERAGALRVYEAFLLRLQQEYELEPTADTRRLAESIRSRIESTEHSNTVELTRTASPVVPPAEQAAEPADTERGKKTGSRRRSGQPIRVVITAAVVALMLSLVSMLRDDAKSPEDNTLIVLPFDAAGVDEAWREVLVDALAINLDGAGGLRVIDPRNAPKVWSKLNKPGAPRSLKRRLNMAVRLGARYALTGRLMKNGDRVRVVVELHDAVARTPLENGKEEIESAVDSVFLLADQISVKLLRRTILAGAELSWLDERRIQTAVPAALKAFIEGERRWRRMQFREAGVAYRRAVAADNAFAFAWYRLYQACIYAMVACGDDKGDNAALYHAQARRHAQHLPARDSAMFEATLEPNGRTRVALLEKITERWDDVEAWYALGVAKFLSPPKQPTMPAQQGLAELRRATERDSFFGPAYLILISDAFARQDTSDAERLIAQLKKIDPNTESALGLGLAFDLAFAKPARRKAAITALDTASTSVLERAHFTLGRNCCADSPTLWRLELEVSQALQAPRHDAAAQHRARHAMVMTYMSRGRYQEAYSTLVTIPSDRISPVSPIWILNSRTGLPVDSTLMRRVSSAGASAPRLGQATVAVTLALLAGNRSAADSAIRKLETLPDSAAPGMAQALRALLDGDTLRAAQELETLIPVLRGAAVNRQVRYDLGRFWLQLDSLERAKGYFSSDVPPALIPLTQFYLGQVHERLGYFAQAREYYARFVEWWQDCDPELHRLLKEGREGLARMEKLHRVRAGT